MYKNSYVIASDFDLQENKTKKVMIFELLRSFVNEITSFSNLKTFKSY